MAAGAGAVRDHPGHQHGRVGGRLPLAVRGRGRSVTAATGPGPPRPGNASPAAAAVRSSAAPRRPDLAADLITGAAEPGGAAPLSPELAHLRPAHRRGGLVRRSCSCSYVDVPRALLPRDQRPARAAGRHRPGRHRRRRHGGRHRADPAAVADRVHRGQGRPGACASRSSSTTSPASPPADAATAGGGAARHRRHPRAGRRWRWC